MAQSLWTRQRWSELVSVYKISEFHTLLTVLIWHTSGCAVWHRKPFSLITRQKPKPSELQTLIRTQEISWTPLALRNTTSFFNQALHSTYGYTCHKKRMGTIPHGMETKLNWQMLSLSRSRTCVWGLLLAESSFLSHEHILRWQWLFALHTPSPTFPLHLLGSHTWGRKLFFIRQ